MYQHSQQFNETNLLLLTNKVDQYSFNFLLFEVECNKEL